MRTLTEIENKALNHKIASEQTRPLPAVLFDLIYKDDREFRTYIDEAVLAYKRELINQRDALRTSLATAEEAVTANPIN